MSSAPGRWDDLGMVLTDGAHHRLGQPRVVTQTFCMRTPYHGIACCKAWEAKAINYSSHCEVFDFSEWPHG